MRGHGNELRKKIQNYSYGLNDHLDLAKKGSTFKGVNDHSEQKVAIKVVDLRNKQSDFIKEQLNMEIQILKKLKHPNILSCLDVYSTVNNCYIITQFCDEGDLQNRITTRGPLKQGEVLVIFKDIMNGYLYLAQEKYIHGNLKPSSIFIKDKIIKISGFTNARKSNKDKDIKREVKFNYYQSPESVKESIFNHKSDIWSLAMILYVLLHGHFPWDFTNKNQFLEKVGRPYSINKQLSEEVKQFLKRSLTTKENRLSLQDLINHPFIKKLTANSLTPQRPQKHIAKNAIESPPNFQLNRKDHVYLNINRVQKQINGQINWMRFLFRLIQRIMNYPQQFNTYVLKFIMIRQLAVQFVQLKRSLQKGENPFTITGWNDFLKDKDKSKKYKQIINKYESRFEKVTTNYKKFVDKINDNNTLGYLNPILNDNFVLSQFNCMVAIKVSLEEIKKLWVRITKQYPTKIKYQKQFPFRFKAELLLLDFLITYYQLNCLWVDDFHRSDNFQKNSRLEIILENQPSQLDASNLEQFEHKLTQLGII